CADDSTGSELAFCRPICRVLSCLCQALRTRGTGEALDPALAESLATASPWTPHAPARGGGPSSADTHTADYKSLPILIVDDEEENLLAFELNFRGQFTIHTANSGRRGLEILAEREVALVITDQRMPEMTGVEFLDKASEIRPDVMRMVLTGYSDINALIDAVNMGRIYHYVTKPWDPDELSIAIRRALDVYRL